MAEARSENIQIGELAKKLGITTRTIRYYEEIGLMGPVARPERGARCYNRDEVRRLKFILKLKELGISLKEMQQLAETFDVHQQDFERITPQLLEILDEQLGKVDEKITRLNSLRGEIAAYRQRIVELLEEQE